MKNKKPREWIIFNGHSDSPSISGHIIPYAENVHVIEKSAYDQAIAQLRKALDALNKLSVFGEGTHGSRHMSNWESLIDMQTEMRERMDYAEQTLKEIKESGLI